MPSEADARNSHGQLPLDDMLAKCRNTDVPIWVGFMGGKTELVKRPPEYLRARSWKWRSNLERAVKANYIPSNEFLQLMQQILGELPPSSREAPKKHWDAGLDLTEVVERCVRTGHEAFVGFYRGRAAFERTSLAELERRRWKWYDPQRHAFVETGTTWIPASQFVRRVTELRHAALTH